MPRLEATDKQAIARAAQGLAPMLARRSALFGLTERASPARLVRSLIEARLDAIADDDHFDCEDDLLWCRVERSGLVLVGVGERAYIVARVAGRGGRAERLLVR